MMRLLLALIAIFFVHITEAKSSGNKKFSITGTYATLGNEEFVKKRSLHGVALGFEYFKGMKYLDIGLHTELVYLSQAEDAEKYNQQNLSGTGLFLGPALNFKNKYFGVGLFYSVVDVYLLSQKSIADETVTYSSSQKICVNLNRNIYKSGFIKAEYCNLEFKKSIPDPIGGDEIRLGIGFRK